jgi:D-alanine--poly(phosphoribitol) ligase subunit 2
MAIGTVMDELLALLRTTLGLGPDVERETPLLSSGLIDSFDVVNLLGALEDRYGVQIDPLEIDAERFDTPTQIMQQLERAAT